MLVNVSGYGSVIYRVDSYVIIVIIASSWYYRTCRGVSLGLSAFGASKECTAAVPARVLLPFFSGGAAASLGTAVQSLLKHPAPRFLSLVSSRGFWATPFYQF